jgi:3-oxoacyl-[acyl-carrier protein] reductase
MSNTLKTYLFAGASSAIAIETAKLLKQNGNKVIGLSTKIIEDVYDEFLQIESYDFNKFPELEDSIDGVVYFPGTINLKPFARLTKADFLTDLEINTLGAVAFIQSYLTNLKKVSNASIVFVSSVAVGVGMPFHASVSLSKGAIEGLTKALAAELAPAIRVNCIAPSLVNTPMASKFINTPDKVELMQKKNPLRKIGEALDIAKSVNFLLSPDSAWISGQVIAVDGGMSTLKNT